MEGGQVILRELESGMPLANLGQCNYRNYDDYLYGTAAGLAIDPDHQEYRLRIDQDDQVNFTNIHNPRTQYVEKQAKPYSYLTGAPSPSLEYSYQMFYRVDDSNQRVFFFDGLNCHYWNLDDGRGPYEFPVRNIQAGDTFFQPLDAAGIDPFIPWIRLSADESELTILNFGAYGNIHDEWPAANAYVTNSDGGSYHIISADDHSLRATYAGQVAVSGDYIMTLSEGVLAVYNTDLQQVDSHSNVGGELRFHIGYTDQVYNVIQQTPGGEYLLTMLSVDQSTGAIESNDIPLGLTSSDIDVSTFYNGESQLEECGTLHLVGPNAQYAFFIDYHSREILHQTDVPSKMWISSDKETLWVNGTNMVKLDLTGSNPPMIGPARENIFCLDADQGLFSLTDPNGAYQLLQAPEMSTVATLRDGYNTDPLANPSYIAAYKGDQIRYMIINQLPGEYAIFDLQSITLYADDEPQVSPTDWLADNSLPASADLDQDTAPGSGQALVFDYLTDEPNLGLHALDQLARDEDWLYRTRKQTDGWALQAEVSNNLSQWTPLTLPTLFQDDEFIYLDLPEGYLETFQFVRFTAPPPPSL